MSKGTGSATFEVSGDDPEGARLIGCAGRFRQALEALIEAGESGITSLEMSSWALRLGHYVFILRRRYGLAIETEHEQHDIGEIAGRHARYRLRSNVRRIEGAEVPARAAMRRAAEGREVAA